MELTSSHMTLIKQFMSSFLLPLMFLKILVLETDLDQSPFQILSTGKRFNDTQSHFHYL